MACPRAWGTQMPMDSNLIISMRPRTVLMDLSETLGNLVEAPPQANQQPHEYRSALGQAMGKNQQPLSRILHSSNIMYILM